MNGDRWPFLASLEKGLHLWMLTLGLGLDCSPCGGFLQAQAVGSPPSRIRAVWSNTKLALQGVGFSLQPRSKAVRSQRVGFTSPSSFPYLSSILGNERLTFGSMLGLSRNLGIAS